MLTDDDELIEDEELTEEDEMTDDDELTEDDELIEELLPVDAVAVDKLAEELMLLLDEVVTAGGSFASLLAPTKLFPLVETV